MSVWDAPPTAAEMKRSSAWDSPPTPEELAGGGGKRTVGGELKRALFTGLGLGDEEAGKAVVAGAGQGAYGVGDEAEAGLEMMGSTLHPYASPQAAEADQAKIYTAARDRNRAESERLKEEHPGAYYPGMAASAILTGGWASPFKAGAKTLGARLLAAMKNGLVGGGVAGLGMSNADLTKGDVGQAALDSGIGSAAGGLLAPAAEGVTSLGGRLIRGLVKPTEAAKALRAKGVDMTVGQMDPGSAVAQVEQAQQSAVGGNILQGQRQKGLESFQRAALGEALPPGRTLLPEGAPVGEQLGSIKEGFENAYGALDGKNLWADIYKGGGKWRPLATEGKQLGAFDSAVMRGKTVAPQSVRDSVKDFLDDQLSMLKPRRSDMKVSADQLHQMRSNIRAEIRGALRGNVSPGDRAAAMMLQKAEDAVSEAMYQQLPPEVVAQLQAADRRYGNFLALAGAQSKATDAAKGFTTAQLSRSAGKDLGTVQKAIGGGSDLLKLAQAGQETIGKDSPITGARILAKVPGSQFLLALMNTPGGKRAALGETGAQQMAAKVADWLREQGLTDATLRALTSQTAGRTATAGE